jgi:two-component system, OmpR family, response regulator
VRDEEVYVLTPEGEQQLRGGKTTITPDELDLLVRVDGVLTLGQIRAGMGADLPTGFDTTMRRMHDRGLMAVRTDDPFAGQLDFRPTKKALDQATAEADVVSSSLQKAGYFVRIARKRTMRNLADAATMTAVVVEDEEHLAKFLKHYLSFEGFDVRTAANRAEIMQALTAQPLPDLVLLDVMLPDADGFDILYKLRAHPAYKDVPIIMLTGKATRESVIRGLAGGADGYVTKPFEADALLDAVRTVTGLPDEPGAAPSSDPWNVDKPR